MFLFSPSHRAIVAACLGHLLYKCFGTHFANPFDAAMAVRTEDNTEKFTYWVVEFTAVTQWA